jgi:hypothetical protein
VCGRAAGRTQWTALDGTFKAPRAVALDPAGNVYVADTGANRIQVRKAATGTRESIGHGELGQPAGIAVGAGGIVIADTGHDRLVRLGAGGSVSAGWAARGTSDGELAGPAGCRRGRRRSRARRRRVQRPAPDLRPRAAGTLIGTTTTIGCSDDGVSSRMPADDALSGRRAREKPAGAGLERWAIQDSNLGPLPYQRPQGWTVSAIRRPVPRRRAKSGRRLPQRADRPLGPVCLWCCPCR